MSPSNFEIRQLAPGDTAAVADLWAQAFAGREREDPGAAEAMVRGPALIAQTGNHILVAADAAGVAGAVRWSDAEGIATFGLLVSAVAGAGRALVRAVERAAQDRGDRLVRCEAPASPALERYFLSLGYLPAGRTEGRVLLERRLPLLTVREQRRTDADAIGRLTGEDPWPFEQGRRPGWFVLADGESVVGVVAVSVARDGTARITLHALDPRYRGRGLELWMLERCALDAETNGALRAVSADTRDLEPYARELEARRWFREDPDFVRRLGEG